MMALPPGVGAIEIHDACHELAPELEKRDQLGSLPDVARLDVACAYAQSERIVISRHGKPCAVLVGIEDYDSEDLAMASSEDFWRMIRQRRASGKSSPLTQVEAQLGITSEKPAGKRAVQPGSRESKRDRRMRLIRRSLHNSTGSSPFIGAD